MPEAARPCSPSCLVLMQCPPFHLPATLSEWTRRRRQVRRTLWRLLGDLPPRPVAVRPTLISRGLEDGYVREDLVFDNGAGDRIPAVLLLPRHVAPPHPAICYLHSHWGEYEVGLEELFEPWPVAETPAVALTRRGYAVLAADAYAFGGRQGQGPGGAGERGHAEETSLSKAFLWQGTSLWAMMVRDDLIALDYL